MSEKTRTNVLVALCCLLCVSTTIGFGLATSRDSELRDTRAEYEQASIRVTELSAGLGFIEISVGRVAGQLEQDATSLRSTIQSLTVIAEEVKNMEDIISNLSGDNSGVDNNDSDTAEVKL